MYSTCIFCQHDLGRNETLPSFPVGERLAYDPVKGRLWVVCRHCGRWNLSPLEERWEAIDEAERRYRDARIKGGSGEIGLARVDDATDLIRVGRPPQVELALWRYGDHFRRRRKQHLIIAGSVLAGGGLAMAGAVAAGIGVIGAWQAGTMLYRGAREGAPWSTVARLRTEKGNILRVKPVHLRRTQIGSTEDGQLRVKIGTARKGSVREGAGPEYIGAEAQTVLGKLFPGVNRVGGAQHEIEAAIARIEAAGSKERFFASLAEAETPASTPPSRGDRALLWTFGPWSGMRRHGLFALPRPVSLAIEMAAHEEQERIALEEDIAVLEREWREAEEIAKIADDMFIPPEVEERLSAMKGPDRPAT
jgi:hypothetical protein